jgi:acyl-CoA hydrolase
MDYFDPDSPSPYSFLVFSQLKTRKGDTGAVDPKTVSSTRTQLAQIMTPLDANVLGKVFGGSLLAMIDLTASATAQRFCGHISVTAAFDRVDFHEPVDVGSLVTMEGIVSYAGRTSMEITIDVFATNLKSGERRQTNTARVTMVAIEDGKPTPVPSLVC